MMRSVLIFILVVPLLMSAVHRHDFGTIREEAGPVTHTFTLPPGMVVSALAGCPCLAVEYPRRPADPSAPLKVTVTLDPERQKGRFYKSVYLRLDGGRRDTLVLTGHIDRTRPRIDTTGYPADFGIGVSLDRSVIDFGEMRRGMSRTLTVPIMNSYEVGMSLDLRPSGRDSTMLFVPFGLRLGPVAKSEFRLTLTIPPSSGRPGSDTSADTFDLWLQPVVNDNPVNRIPVKVRLIP